MSGKNIYFTDQELNMIIEYIIEATSILGDAEDTCEKVNEDMNNGLGSALRKLYKGKNGEKNFSQYKTKRTKNQIMKE